MQMTFKQWVKSASITKNHAGDLIGDFKNDSTLPEDFADLDAMRAYLTSEGACNEAIRAASIVWRRYQGAIPEDEDRSEGEMK